MPSNYLIFCHPLLLPSIFRSIRVFSNESALSIRWPKYWSFSFSISPSNEYSELISFRMDWLDLLAVQETLKSLLQHHSSKASILWHSYPYMTTGKTIALTRRTFSKRDPGLDGKESTCNAGDPVWSLGLEGPLEEMATHSISCLENPMNRETWWATVHGVTKSQTWLNDLAHMRLDTMQKTVLTTEKPIKQKPPDVK